MCRENNVYLLSLSVVSSILSSQKYTQVIYIYIMNIHAFLSIILFVVLFLSIVFWKPPFLFKKDGSIREFGIGKRQTTVVPIWLVVLIIAFLSYLTIHVGIQKNIFKF